VRDKPLLDSYLEVYDGLCSMKKVRNQKPCSTFSWPSGGKVKVADDNDFFCFGFR